MQNKQQSPSRILIRIAFGLVDFGGIIFILSTQELACLFIYAGLLVSISSILYIHKYIYMFKVLCTLSMLNLPSLVWLRSFPFACSNWLLLVYRNTINFYLISRYLSEFSLWLDSFQMIFLSDSQLSANSSDSVSPFPVFMLPISFVFALARPQCCSEEMIWGTREPHMSF